MSTEYSSRIQKLDRGGSAEGDYIMQDLKRFKEELAKEGIKSNLQELNNAVIISQLGQLDSELGPDWSFPTLDHPHSIKITFLIQRALKGTPYDCGVIDGILENGGKTQKSIQRFQKNFMGSGNGIPDSSTIKKVIEFIGGTGSPLRNAPRMGGERGEINSLFGITIGDIIKPKAIFTLYKKPDMKERVIGTRNNVTVVNVLRLAGGKGRIEVDLEGERGFIYAVYKDGKTTFTKVEPAPSAPEPAPSAPEPAPSVSEIHEVVKPHIISREEWGALPMKNIDKQTEYTEPLNKELTSIVIHHAGGQSTSVERIQKMQMDSKNFDDIGYHFYIGEDGKIYTGREIKYMGAHAGQSKEANDDTASIRDKTGVSAEDMKRLIDEARKKDPDYGAIGIVIDGDYNHTDINPAQEKSLRELLGYLKTTYDIPKQNIMGHRHVKGELVEGHGFTFEGLETKCPGDHLAGSIDNIVGTLPVDTELAHKKYIAVGEQEKSRLEDSENISRIFDSCILRLEESKRPLTQEARMGIKKDTWDAMKKAGISLTSENISYALICQRMESYFNDNGPRKGETIYSQNAMKIKALLKILPNELLNDANRLISTLRRCSTKLDLYNWAREVIIFLENKRVKELIGESLLLKSTLLSYYAVFGINYEGGDYIKPIIDRLQEEPSSLGRYQVNIDALIETLNANIPEIAANNEWKKLLDGRGGINRDLLVRSMLQDKTNSSILSTSDIMALVLKFHIAPIMKRYDFNGNGTVDNNEIAFIGADFHAGGFSPRNAGVQKRLNTILHLSSPLVLDGDLCIYNGRLPVYSLSSITTKAILQYAQSLSDSKRQGKSPEELAEEFVLASKSDALIETILYKELMGGLLVDERYIIPKGATTDNAYTMSSDFAVTSAENYAIRVRDYYKKLTS